MSEHTTNHLLNVEYLADNLQRELASVIGDVITFPLCCDYVFNAFDDLLPTRLEWSSPITDTRRTIIASTLSEVPNIITIESVIRGILESTDFAIIAELTNVIPLKTWANIFIGRIGTTVRIEITGDRRIDEWHVLTNSGTLSFDKVLENFTQALREAATGSIDGGLPDIEYLARLLLTEKPFKRK